MKQSQARAEINFTNLHSNINEIHKRILPTTKFGLVVKADAYGHGAVPVVREAVARNLADMIIVGKLEEAAEIKEEAGDMPILILGNVLPNEILPGMEEEYIFSVYSIEYMRQMNRIARQRRSKFHVHIRIDVYGSGMGCSIQEFQEYQKEIFQMAGIQVDGVYSHLYSGYSFNRQQIQNEAQLFDGMIQEIPMEMRQKLLVHIESSPMIFMFPEYQYDMVRSGTAVYGLPCSRDELPLKPLLALKANIFRVSYVEEGQMLAYSMEDDQRDGQPKKIARVMFGYWDCPFLMSRRNLKVMIRGKLYDVMEEPCMDNTCIDITGSEDIQIGDEVCFLGDAEGIYLKDVMRRCGIQLEHSERLCLISKRLVRYYVYTGEHFIQMLMKQVYDEAPLLKQADEQYGTLTLGTYLETIQPTEKLSGLPKQDVGEAVFDYLLPLVGEETAHAAAKQVEEQQLLLTANHHEVEFCAQSVQGNILYDALLKKQGFSGQIVPIISNTTVNMSNANFPRGMLIYDTAGDLLKIPVFPFKMRNSLVAVAEPFTENMVHSAEKVLRKEYATGHIGETIYEAAKEILEDCYLDANVLDAKRYASQAFLINRMLGKKLYHDEEKEVLYIELEEITKRLLDKDIKNPETLPYRILFDEKLRTAVLTELDGRTGCWGTESLEQWERPNGTHFFWGVDARQRRFSLCLTRQDGTLVLRGQDMAGETHCIPYTETDVAVGMENRQLIPGLFLSFLELHLLRNYTLLGGCFQSLYLQEMADGLTRALTSCQVGEEICQTLPQKKNYYLSGPMPALGEGKQTRVPMSTVELLAQGGILEEKLEELLETSLLKADEQGVFTFYGDLIKKEQQWTEWWEQLKKAYRGGIVQ